MSLKEYFKESHCWYNGWEQTLLRRPRAQFHPTTMRQMEPTIPIQRPPQIDRQIPRFLLSSSSRLKVLPAANTMICHIIILNTRIESLVRNPFSSFQGTRVSLEELHIFIVLLLTYCTFKSRKIIKLLSDMDLVSHCDKMTWKESFT